MPATKDKCQNSGDWSGSGKGYLKEGIDQSMSVDFGIPHFPENKT